MNEHVIVRSRARHGDHDSDPALRGCGAQQGFGVFGKPSLPVCEIENGCLRRWRRPGSLYQAMQDFQNRVYRGQDVRFGSPERGQPHFGQPELQRAEVAPTESQVMQKIRSAYLIVWMNFTQACFRHDRLGDHIRPDGHEFPEDVVDVRISQGSAAIGVVRCQSSLQWTNCQVS